MAPLAKPADVGAPAVTGWPGCPDNCSGHGECSHIGVCSCHLDWSGDSCSVPRCLNRCSGHGRCVSRNNKTSSCECEPGYGGRGCEVAGAPSPPPWLTPPAVAAASSAASAAAVEAAAVEAAAEAAAATPAVRPPTLETVASTSALAQLSEPLGRPLAPLLPSGRAASFWAVDGAPPQVSARTSAARQS